jgi:large subunit ribosomal protein L13
LASSQVALQAKVQPSKTLGTTLYVDATNLIAGRLCSNVAKLLLNGNKVVVLNAEKTLISGQRSSVMQAWKEYLHISSVVNPVHGPFHQRTPNGILTRMIRGMVPRRKPKGIAAMHRLRVYVGVPKEYEKAKPQSFENSKATRPAAYYIPLSEIASKIGWKGGKIN